MLSFYSYEVLKLIRRIEAYIHLTIISMFLCRASYMALSLIIKYVILVMRYYEILIMQKLLIILRIFIGPVFQNYLHYQRGITLVFPIRGLVYFCEWIV